jgi:hypothetical protein
MLISNWSSSNGRMPVAFPASDWSRQTKPGLASASALIGSRSATKSAISGAVSGATRRPMLTWAMWNWVGSVGMRRSSSLGGQE